MFSEASYDTAFFEAITGDISGCFNGADTTVLFGAAVPVYALHIIICLLIIVGLAAAVMLVGRIVFKSRYKAKQGDAYA